MRLLITGGAGFIGSNFIRYLIKKYPEYKIVNLDKLTYAGNLENLRDIQNHPNYKFIKGDICNKDIVDKVIKDCDIIINFAAQTHVDRSIKDAGVFIKTNIHGTHVLLEAAKKYKIKLFLQIGTDEVYGSLLKGEAKEADALKPNSPYAASKASADLLCQAYRVTYKLPVIITRSSNNFGPYQYPEKIIPLFITNLMENKKVPLYGDGLNVRDWLFILDNCRAIDLVLHKGKIGEIYNIGADNLLSNVILTRMLLEKLGKPLKSIEYITDRPGHDRRYALDCAKIRKLGFRPKYNFQDAIGLTIEWYKNNKNWWKKLKRKY